MKSEAVVALLALSDANKAMKKALIAFAQMGDRETAKLLRESIEDNTAVMRALVLQEQRTHPEDLAS